MALIQFVFLRRDTALCYSSCRQCVFILNCPIKVVVDFAKLGILESEIVGLTFFYSSQSIVIIYLYQPKLYSKFLYKR